MKFSIITPVRNGEKFFTETLESVLSQKGDFEIEYLVMDSLSTDSTPAIAAEYQKKITSGNYPIHCNEVVIKFISQKDTGPCDAIRKGLALATGDICVGLGGDDIYLPGAFEAIAKTFKKYPEIEWLTGRSTLVNSDSAIYGAGISRVYYQPWLARGIYGRNAYWIPYEATFWRRSLLLRAGPPDETVKIACDYSWWVKLAAHVPLYTLDVIVNGFRIHPSQISSNLTLYKSEQVRIVPEQKSDKIISLFFLLAGKIPKPLASLVPYLYRLWFGNQHFKVVRLDDNGEPQLFETSLIRTA